MLKRWLLGFFVASIGPAAFRRLCVETQQKRASMRLRKPAAFRRLCVETECLAPMPEPCGNQPPSGGCVLKRGEIVFTKDGEKASRLQAAVC